MFMRLFSVLLVLLLFRPDVALAQAREDSAQVHFGNGFGLDVVLTNSGFGLGGYLKLAAGETTSLVGEWSLGSGKDEREVKFFGFGRTFIPHKANYLLMSPVHFGVQQRIFAASIEDDFRPFIQVIGGPTLGWEYPYFEDENGNGVYDEGERTFDPLSSLHRGSLRPGMGGMIAIGANFGTTRRTAQGVRIGYSLHYFFDGVQLLEPAVQPRQHFVGSPVISLSFGRLF
jgi:hypothetical protein